MFFNFFVLPPHPKKPFSGSSVNFFKICFDLKQPWRQLKGEHLRKKG